MFTKTKKYTAPVALFIAAGLQTAQAAVPAGATSALGDAATDAATVGGLALVAVVAAAAFKYLRRGL